MKLEVHKLSEASRAQLTGKRFLAAVKSQMGFEVRSGAKPLQTNITLMRLLTYLIEQLVNE